MTRAGVSAQPRWMFSATVIGATRRKCWCTIPMPAAMAWAGEWNWHDRTVDLDVAGVGSVDAREHVAQRRLAGAVLAEQRVDLAAAQLEVDVASATTPSNLFETWRAATRRGVGRTSTQPSPRRRGQPSTPDTPSTAQSMR